MSVPPGSIVTFSVGTISIKPAIGVVKSTFRQHDTFYAIVETDNKPWKLVQWLKDKFGSKYDSTKLMTIPTSKLQVLKDVDFTEEQVNLTQIDCSSEGDFDSNFITMELASHPLKSPVIWLSGIQPTIPAFGILTWTGKVRSLDGHFACVDFECDEIPMTPSDPRCKRYSARFGCVNKGLLLPINHIQILSDFEPVSQNEMQLVDSGETILKLISGNTEKMDTDDDQAYPMTIKPEVLRSKVGTLVSKIPGNNLGTIVWDGTYDGVPAVLITFEHEIQDEHPIFQPALPAGFGKMQTSLLISHIELMNKEKFAVFEKENRKVTAASGPPHTSKAVPLEELDNIFPLSETQDPDLKKILPPIQLTQIMDLAPQYKGGIQGFNNSCYIDSTLFALFGCLDAFEEILLKNQSDILVEISSAGRESKSNISLKEKVRQVLAYRVINPLRSRLFVPFQNINSLRQILSTLSQKVHGDLMDVEEFLYLLFEEIFELPGFISYDSGTSDFIHSIAVPTNSNSVISSFERLIVSSFEASSVKLACRPSPALILQLPYNDGSRAEVVRGIIPTLSLNISKLLARDIAITGKEEMGLVAVICLESNHFTTFVKCGTGQLSHWIFMDSSPSNGEPQIIRIDSLPEIMIQYEEKRHVKLDGFFLSPQQKIIVNKFLTKAYLCFYV